MRLFLWFSNTVQKEFFFAIGESGEQPKLEDMEVILDTMEETTDIMDITAIIMVITDISVTIKVIIFIIDPNFTTADILEMEVDFTTGRNKKSWLRIFTQNSSHVQFWKPYSQTIESVENDVMRSVLKFPFWVSISKALKSSSFQSFERVCWGVRLHFHVKPIISTKGKLLLSKLLSIVMLKRHFRKNVRFSKRKVLQVCVRTLK